MTVRERFQKTLDFEKPDRLPIFELAGWWPETLKTWQKDGLDFESFNKNSYEYMGMDDHREFYIKCKTEKFEYTEKPNEPKITNARDYHIFKKDHLFPEDWIIKNTDRIECLKEMQSRGDIAVWVNFEGFFWFPRTLFGIEPHFYAFYDHPALMHEMNGEYCEYLLNRIDEFCDILIPDFMIVSEDMSYNHGPMCGKDMFDAFMAPYYRRLTTKIKSRGDIKIFMDSDGNPEEMIPWFLSVGVEGITPNERQAGVDINRIRQNHPRLLLLGGFNKMVMDKGEEAIRAEFERIFPVMRQGGYIPGCDHQTPPNVTLSQYRQYQSVQREYCKKAVL